MLTVFSSCACNGSPAGALWRAVEAVSRRVSDHELADTAAMRAEMHEARVKEHLGRVVDAAFWTHEATPADAGLRAAPPAGATVPVTEP